MRRYLVDGGICRYAPQSRPNSRNFLDRIDMIRDRIDMIEEGVCMIQEADHDLISIAG